MSPLPLDYQSITLRPTRSHGARIFIGILIGIDITVPAVLAILLSGAGDGSYSAACVFFPVPTMLAWLTQRITIASIAIGLVQFSIYGAVIGGVAREKMRAALLWIAGLHLVAVLICLAAMWW